MTSYDGVAFPLPVTRDVGHQRRISSRDTARRRAVQRSEAIGRGSFASTNAEQDFSSGNRGNRGKQSRRRFRRRRTEDELAQAEARLHHASQITTIFGRLTHFPTLLLAGVSRDLP